MPALLAGSGLFGCSLQSFDYLTSGGADAGGIGASGTSGSGGTLPEAGAEAKDTGVGVGSPDSSVTRDAGEGTEASMPVGSSTLVNPSFEQGYSGWTFTPSSAMGKYAYTQYPPTGATTIDGQYELATWSGTDAFTVQVSQTLSNLADGTYAFAGNFNCGSNNAAYMYTRNCGGPDQRQNIAPTAPTAWDVVAISGIAVTGGTCEVGFYVDASPSDWLNTDAFTFVKVADPLSSDASSDDGGADAVAPASDDASGE